MTVRLPDWADRERWDSYQSAIYDEIIGHFDNGERLVLLDASCGSGKSLIAFMVGQYLETSLYYLVGTKTLQDQMERSFPNMALIKGKANYTPNGIEVVDAPHWSDPTCADCDFDSTSKMCSFCTMPEACPYPVARNAAELSSFTCTNMAYALGEWTSPKSRFRNRGLVVIDECDVISDEIQNHVSVSISPRMKQRLRLKSPTELLGRVKTVESAWPQWFDYAIPHVERELKRLPKRTLPDRRRVATVDRLLDRMMDVAQDLEGWVYDPANTASGETIEFKPVKVDKIAPRVLWGNGQRFLAMSASLGSPEQYVNDLGWNESYGYVIAKSTFDPARRPVYFCPSAMMTKKTEVEEWPKMAVAVSEVIDMFEDKNILVHSHTNNLTKYLMNALEDSDRPIFGYSNPTERADAIANFENTPGSVLIAPSLDRGYDNSSIDVVVLCKLPYPYLGSKQVQKRFYEHDDGKAWYSNSTGQAIVQMCGRAMRAENDEGICLILDSVFSRYYSEWTYSSWERDEHGKSVKRQHHRFLPTHLLDAYHAESDVAFELRQRIKRRTKEAKLRVTTT